MMFYKIGCDSVCHGLGHGLPKPALKRHHTVMSEYHKMDINNFLIYLDATVCTEQISEYIWMPNCYRINIQIYLYFGNSTNTDMNNI